MSDKNMQPKSPFFCPPSSCHLLPALPPLLLLLLLASPSVSGNTDASVGVRPNLVFILTDDQRYDTLGCTGNTFTRTPHLDRLAAEDVLVTNAHVTSAICTPSRACYFLGQYERRHGVNFNSGTVLAPEAWAKSYPVLSVRDLEWKYIRYFAVDRSLFAGCDPKMVWSLYAVSPEQREAYACWLTASIKGEVPAHEELFHLASDPHETTNLAARPAHSNQLDRMHDACQRMVTLAKGKMDAPPATVPVSDKAAGDAPQQLEAHNTSASFPMLIERAEQSNLRHAK